jgi:hypothetical protein
MENNMRISFFVIWIVLGIPILVFYTLSRDASLKRKLHPWFMISESALFAISINWTPDVIFIMGLILITSFNIYIIKFCDNCGTTNFFNKAFSKDNHCIKCGEKLK